MPTTEHIHLPLYTDEETPDLSTTGHYNHAMEILDAEAGELENSLAEETKQRKAADAELEGKVEEEATTRADADKAINDTLATKADSADVTALGRRVDNAEAEITANSADLTGIKGLTYGTGQQVFLEEENGEYSSPALEEIQHEIEDSKVTIIAPTKGSDTAPTTAASSSASLAVGYLAAAGYGGVAVGTRANATASDASYANYSTAVGYGASSTSSGVALGCNATASYVSALSAPIAIGANTRAGGQACVVIGSNSSSGGSYRNCTILGPNVNGATPNTVVISAGVSKLTVTDSRSSVVYFNTDGHAPVLANVADPAYPQDAATKNYVDTAIAGVSGGGSGLTVISPGDKQAADIYAEVQAAWPNCVLHAGSQYLWPSSDTTGDSPTYTFSGMDSDLKLHLAMCGADSYSVAAMPIATPATTFGDFVEPTA